jgi:nucleoside-diphosphate-sugar epimerase
MHAVVAAAMAGGQVRVEPRLFGTNEYVYVKDVAQGVALACEKPLKSRAFNIGTASIARTEDVAGALRRACPGAAVEVVTGQPERYDTPRDQPLDITRARQELGYHPRFDLNQGIADFVGELKRAG